MEKQNETPEIHRPAGAMRLSPEFQHLYRPEYSETGNQTLADQKGILGPPETPLKHGFTKIETNKGAKIETLKEVQKRHKTEERQRRERQHNREFCRNLKAQFLAAKIARFERTPEGLLIAWFPQTMLLQGPILPDIWGFISVLSVENAFATENECKDYINRLSEQMRQETGNVITLRVAATHINPGK